MANQLHLILEGSDQALQVILLREKVSKLSEQMTVSKSIYMTVVNTNPSSVEKKWHEAKFLQVKITCLKDQMDQKSLAE